MVIRLSFCRIEGTALAPCGVEKILLMTFKALNNLCSSYISDLLETFISLLGPYDRRVGTC